LTLAERAGLLQVPGTVGVKPQSRLTAKKRQTATAHTTPPPDTPSARGFPTRNIMRDKLQKKAENKAGYFVLFAPFRM